LQEKKGPVFFLRKKLGEKETLSPNRILYGREGIAQRRHWKPRNVMREECSRKKGTAVKRRTGLSGKGGKLREGQGGDKREFESFTNWMTICVRERIIKCRGFG